MADDAARKRRAKQRHERVRAGIDALDRWLADRVRQGLAGLESAGPEPFERLGARLVDAQAGALGQQVKGLAGVAGGSADWPVVLLGRLGRIALLTEAFRRLDDLPDTLRHDVRRRIGWSVRKARVREVGPRITDTWAVVGQTLVEDDRLRTRRTWLWGRETEKSALILEFAGGFTPFQEGLDPGCEVEAQLCFWPGAAGERALVIEHGAPAPLSEWVGSTSVRAHLDRVAAILGREPWVSRIGGVLRAVTPVRDSDRWFAVDAEGRGLPLAPADPWQLHALAGGRPIGLAGEWSGGPRWRLHPMAAWIDGAWEPLA